MDAENRGLTEWEATVLSITRFLLKTVSFNLYNNICLFNNMFLFKNGNF